MKIHTTKIQKGFVICMPKEDMRQMGFKEGELIVLKFNKEGIIMAKAGTFDVLNSYFTKMDEEQELLVRKIASIGKNL